MKHGQNTKKINLVYSVRTQAELGLCQRVFQKLLKCLVKATRALNLFLLLLVTQMHALHDRLPVLIANGELEQAAELNFDPNTTHVMLCGNPQMVEDTKAGSKSSRT